MGSRDAVRARPVDRGFVLVGVVMLVLALTILGLSLFSLSSFEAQFLQRSLDEAQAYSNAVNGFEHAKFALAAENRLESVGENLPFEGIVGAVATQGLSSTGPVDWSQPVTIQVVAEKGGARKTLEAQFTATRPLDPYRYLFTAHDRITLYGWGEDPHTRRDTTTNLNGFSWQNHPDTSWADSARFTYHPVLIGGAPRPDLNPFFSAQLPLAIPIARNDATNRYNLHAGAGNVQFFRMDSLDTPVYSPMPRIDVTGTAVWLFEKGFRFGYQVEVTGPPDAVLVIAAKPGFSGSDPTLAMDFHGSLKSTVVPVFLVSSGRVILEHYNNYDLRSDIIKLSVFAENITIMGPGTTTIPQPLMNLWHPISMDVPGGLIDQLRTQGALPGTTVETPFFTLVPGSWREIGDVQ